MKFTPGVGVLRRFKVIKFRRHMAEILPIRRKTLSNHSINQSELTFKNLIIKYYDLQVNLQQCLTFLLMLTRHPFCYVDIGNLILNQPKFASYFGHFLNLTNHQLNQIVNKLRSGVQISLEKCFQTRSLLRLTCQVLFLLCQCTCV